jgi:Tfp pilus assembly protein PilO
LLTLGAAVALLFIWFAFLWGPQGGDLDDAKKRIDAAEETNGALELRLSRLQASQSRAPQLQAARDELQRAIPDDPQLAQFILDANDAASAAAVDFLSISPSLPELGASGLPEIGLTISVTGGYFAVLDYLDRLEELPRIVVVDTLGLTPGGSDDGPLALSVSISARMFATAAPQLGLAATTTTVPPDSQQQVTTSTQAPPEITVTANR